MPKAPSRGHTFSVKSHLRAALLFVLPAVAAACVSTRIGTYETAREQREATQDNHLAYRPDRGWRLLMRWAPDPADDARAFVEKEFRFYAHSEKEKALLKSRMESFPEPELFYQWIESGLEPLGDNDRRAKAEVFTEGGAQVVALTYRAIASVPREGLLRPGKFLVPDPFLKKNLRGCAPSEVAQIEAGESLGFELWIQSRSPAPLVESWKFREDKTETGSVRRWSVAEGPRIGYRVWIRTTHAHSACPLPPSFSRLVLGAHRALYRETGAQW